MKSIYQVLFYAILGLPIMAFGDEVKRQKVSFFEENKGQIVDQNGKPRNDILFLSRQQNYIAFFKADGISYQLFENSSPETMGLPTFDGRDLPPQTVLTHRLDMNWLGANPDVSLIPSGIQNAFSNFYLAHCPDGILGVSNFQELIYKNIYPNIDLKYYHSAGLLKYDFIVRPGGDPGNIRILVNGAVNINVLLDGSVSLTTSVGTLQEARPEIYQQGEIINGEWKLENNILSFSIDDYNKGLDLIIDPLVMFSTIKEFAYTWGGGGTVGGSNYVKFNHLTVGPTGLLYYIRSAYTSGGLSIPSSFQAYLFISDSNGVVQHTISTSDFIETSSVDQQGNIYMAGQPRNYFTATVGAHQQTIGGGKDAFLRKFDPSGVPLWSTFYGGSGDENGSCAVDVMGNPYLYGSTSSADGIATPGSSQSTFAGVTDGYIVKFDKYGARIWGTYVGGPQGDSILSLGTSQGILYATGSTYSLSGIATPGSFQSSKMPNTGQSGFITRFDTTGMLHWSTYYGDSSRITSCAVDSTGRLSICGTTSDPNGLWTPGAFQMAFNGKIDGFVARFDTTGNRLWSTNFGGSGRDWLTSLCLDVQGNIFVVGHSSSPGLATPFAFKEQGPLPCGLIAEFDTAGQRVWSSYVDEPSHSDFQFLSCATFGNKFYVGGFAKNSSDPPRDGFLYTLNHCRNPPPVVISNGPTDFCAGDSVILSVNSPVSSLVRWLKDDTIISTGTSLIVKTPGRYVAWVDSCTNAFSQPLEVRVSKPRISSIFKTQVPCTGAPVAEASVNVNGGIQPYNYSWSGLAVNAPNVSNLDTGFYTITVTDSVGCSIYDTIQITQQLQPQVQGSTTPVPCTGVPFVGSIGIQTSGGNPPYIYSWSNLPFTGDTLLNMPGGYYTVTVFDQIGCTTTATFHIDSMTTTEPSDPIVQVCAVTVDSISGKNQVVWEKTGFVQAKYYKVFRLDASGQMVLLDVVPRHYMSTFIDTSSTPQQQSYSYAISEVDSCGNESDISNRHKTIHLSANLGLNGEINLIWNSYEGAEYQRHYILRSVNQGNFIPIAEVPNVVTSYSDLNPPPGNKRYKIEIDLPTICNPMAKVTAYSKVSSNFVMLPANKPKLVPNPSNDKVMILGEIPQFIRVFDASGKLVLEAERTDLISISHLYRGVYLFCLYDQQGILYHKERLVKL